MINILILICFIVWAFVMVRNYNTYRVRMAILDTHYPTQYWGLELHKRLPSYDRMLFHPAFYLKWSKQDWLEYIGEGE